ncbi:hypothetical protein B296_00057995 [Ensete ventricosum]|uniref:Uncharacterized protein n=1 Tax=Ensete ventricosum TaxID=4639 RepID=A0A426XP13_ENSVE|nr:hypothetical protein B296_00057995 [Ensete ventricosum]
MSSASSHFEFQSIELSTHRSRVLSCPSGDSVSVVVVPSSSALDDSGTADALVVMQSFFNVDSIVTTRRLVEVRKNYFIPLEYELHVPLSGERPYNAFPCGFGLSTDALEAGLRFPLHPVIEVCLEQWRISPYQIAPNSWRFLTEWTSRTVSGFVPALSVDETELVEILRGILSVSRGVKDMNEAWLVEAGLSPAPRDEVRWRSIEGEDPLVPRWSTISGSSPLWTKGPLFGEYLRGALHPTLVKQVYECSSEELMNRVGKSAVWGLHFVSALIYQVHDTGRLVWSQHKKILTLWAMNKELKASVSQELAAVAERWAKELEAEIEKMTIELEAVAAYKASRGFESSLEKMGRVSYEFGYRVTLERLQGKHPDIMIELDPFAKCPEDANVKMDLDQPFNDDTPLEKQPAS